MRRLLPIAVAGAYCIPQAFHDPALAQYIIRGWLGCLCAWALFRGWRIGAWSMACILVWEGSTSVCGAFFAGWAPVVEGLCDRGTGLPVTLPALALTVVAVLKERAHA